MSEQRVREALERSQGWLALGRAFGPPRDLESVARDLRTLRSRARGGLANALDAALAALEGETTDALARGHDGLFGVLGAVPARESAWADARAVSPTDLADLRGFLAAFGLEERGEVADHIVSECELASVLALKEAWAIGQGWDDRAETARTAYQRLLADHVLRWAGRFATRVERSGAPAFYAAAARALLGFLTEEAQRLGMPTAGCGDSSLPPHGPDDIECGGCAGTSSLPPF